MNKEKDLKKYIEPVKLRNFCIGFWVFVLLMGLVQPVLIVGFGIYAAIFTIVWLVGFLRRKSKMDALKTDGKMEAIVSDFENAKVILNDRVRVGENYIFFKGSGKLLLYTEVLWIYRFVQRYMFIPIQSFAMVGDATGKVKGLCKIKSSKAGEAEIKELMTAVYNKNPQVVLGYGLDKQKQYRELAKKK